MACLRNVCGPFGASDPTTPPIGRSGPLERPSGRDHHRKPVKIVGQISKPDLRLGPGHPDGPDDQRSAGLHALGAKHVLDPRPRPGPIAGFLAIGQRFVAHALALDVGTVAQHLEKLDRVFRTIRGIGIDRLVGVVSVQQVMQDLSVMDRGVGHDALADELVARINADLVFVAMEIDPVFLGPPVVRVFLAAFCLTPAFGDLAVFDLLVFFAGVALLGRLHDAGVHDLTFGRVQAHIGEQVVQGSEQALDQVRFGQGLLKKADGVRVGHTVAQALPEEAHEGQAVQNLVFHVFLGQVVHGLEDQDFEHDDDVIGFAAGVGLAFLVTDGLEVATKQGPS